MTQPTTVPPITSGGLAPKTLPVRQSPRTPPHAPLISHLFLHVHFARPISSGTISLAGNCLHACHEQASGGRGVSPVKTKRGLLYLLASYYGSHSARESNEDETQRSVHYTYRR